jgi:uncharacterized membrane protein
MLVGDRERERAAVSLRRHYVSGRLTFEEFMHRTEIALRARSASDLRTALRDLPLGWNDMPESVHAAARSVGRVAARGALLLALSTVWFVFSFVLLIVFLIALFVNGPSLLEVLGIPLIWLLGTYGLVRTWRHGAHRAPDGVPAGTRRSLGR